MKKSKKLIIIAAFVALALHTISCATPKKEILFPKREHVKNVSEIFFKHVNRNQPMISKAEFFARSEAYPSAYIHLTHFVTKTDYFKNILPSVEQAVNPGLDAFNQQKNKISIEHGLRYPEKAKISRLQFYLLILHTLTDDFKANRLSGSNAFRYWNLLLNLTLDAYQKKKTLEDAAILAVSSHFVFFKNYEKWQKRSRKIRKKVAKKQPDNKGDAFCQLVFSY